MRTKKSSAKLSKQDPNSQVTKLAPRILATLNKNFGLDTSTITSAINGDISANKALGERARSAEIQLMFAPLVAEKVSCIIEGTKAVNEAQKQIIDSAKSNALAIDGMVNSTKLAEQNFYNAQLENNQSFVAARKSEAVRHKNTASLIEMRAYVDAHVKSVDSNLQRLQINNNVQTRQLAADKKNDIDVASKWLQSGNGQEVDLIQKPNYLTSPIQKVRGMLTDAKNALGF